MPASTATMSPLEQTIADRMRIRVAAAPSLLMTAFVGGGIGAAVGLATGAEGRGSALKYGALGAALGLAGSFAYALYNTHSAAQQALVEHQSLLAASIKAAPARAARPAPPHPPPPSYPHHTGHMDGYPWWG